MNENRYACAAFKYNSYHSVLEVTKQDFDECVTSKPISYDTSGSTTVLLTMPAKRYFICGAPGHCLNGMKMAIEVADLPAPTTPTSPPPALVPPPPPETEYAAGRQPAPAPTVMASAPAPMPWAPLAAAPPRCVGHKTKKHKKKGYCAPNTPPARAPTAQSEERDFPEAAFESMSSPPPPPTSGGPDVLRSKLEVALAALGGFALVAL
jgi:hypothetical protein